MKKTVYIAVIALCLLFASSALAEMQSMLYGLQGAKGNLGSGMAKAHMGVAVSEKWDDNVYNTATGEKADFITTITPALLFSVGDKYMLQLGAAMDANIYMDLTDENFNAILGDGKLTLQLPAGLNIEVSDSYIDTKDPRPEENKLRASHFTNDAMASVSYMFPGTKLNLDIDYSNVMLRYGQSENEVNDTNNSTIGGEIGYKFLPKTSSVVGYSFNQYDYANNPNDGKSTTNKVNLGLRWDATAKLSGKILGEYSMKIYDSDTFEDANLFGLDMSLMYAAAAGTDLTLSAFNSFKETTYGGTTVYSPSSHYISTGGSVGVKQMVMNELNVKLNAGYQMNSYEDTIDFMDARSDNVISAGIGVEYGIGDFVTVGADYSYSNTDSNDSNRDELHNKAQVSVKAAI